MRRRILVMGTALVVTMLTLSGGLIVVTMIWWLWVGIVWRIVVGMPWIMLRRMLGMTVHWWRHTRMHVHVTVWRWVIGWVFRHWWALVVTIVVVIIFVDWVHAVHLVSLTLVILLLISSELFPGVTDQSSDGPTLRRNTGFGLLQAEDMSREEHIVTSLVTLTICLFIWWLVFCHLLFITFAIFASSVRKRIER
jgi:hypothetical protein